jgi:hypothetical protein
MLHLTNISLHEDLDLDGVSGFEQLCILFKRTQSTPEPITEVGCPKVSGLWVMNCRPTGTASNGRMAGKPFIAA